MYMYLFHDKHLPTVDLIVATLNEKSALSYIFLINLSTWMKYKVILKGQ